MHLSLELDHIGLSRELHISNGEKKGEATS